MLHCGSVWRPTLVHRVVETLNTSTRPAIVDTDLGLGILKGMGNPQGPESLVCELISAELAAWLGLRIPPFSVIQIENIDIPMNGVGTMQYGPAFISKKIDGATGDAGDIFLRKITNPQDIAKLIALDSFIRNADRYPPEGTEQRINFDNLFFAPDGRKLILYAIDHSHCFIETTFDMELNDDYIISDNRIYGYFPHFAPYLRREYVVAAAERLRQMDRDTAAEIVAAVPAEWGLTVDQRERLAVVIHTRALQTSAMIGLRLSDALLDMGK